MTREELLARITIDPNICFGKPCIRGHRIWVSLILDFLAAGQSVAEILESYPGLAEDDVLACIAYGAEIARERYVEISVPGPETALLSHFFRGGRLGCFPLNASAPVVLVVCFFTLSARSWRAFSWLSMVARSCALAD